MTTRLLSHVPGSFTTLPLSEQGNGSAFDALNRPSGPPKGFPASVEGPMVWSAAQGNPANASVLQLQPEDVIELEAALKSFQALELDGDQISREHFRLPNLESRLAQCALEVHRGSGMCIVRGLAPGQYTPELNTMLFLGIASYIGDQRGVQNSSGFMLSHVVESKSWTVPREKRHGIHTNGSLPFHNDMGCEILSMQVRDCAVTGGRTNVVSAGAIYNEMMKNDSWALDLLAQPNWPVRVAKKDSSYVLSPLLEFHDGKLMISMDPSRVGPHPAGPAGLVPRLLPEQQAALGLLQQHATNLQVPLQTRPGDLVFLNNYAVLHARDAYEDGEASSRHLVRMWLRNSELGWQIPSSMHIPWDAVFGQRAKKVRNHQYPVDPLPDYMAPKFSNGTAAFVGDEEDEDDIEE
ncbi:hypothetical protein F5X96DRAFT_237441 [Biscogniauxia mediterranea]|nr:hypothetical protein F5X96DRAFT_237441 [Biscogniauxia mediterranea]